MKIAYWNVCTILDSDDNDRPQQRSALMARELSRLDIDIPALSEVRFAEEGSLIEHGAGYTFLWSGSGRGKEEHCRSGLGFMMENNIAKKLHALPTGHSDPSCPFDYQSKGTSLPLLSVSTVERCKQPRL